MALTEARRSAIYESMKAVHGADIPEDIMSSFPPSDDDQLATRRDLNEVRTELRLEIAELRADLTDKLSTMQSSLTRTFGTWLFASQAGVIAAVAVLVAFLG